MNTTIVHHLDVLHTVMAKLQNCEDVSQTMDMLIRELQRIRQQVSPAEWKQLATIDCRLHPLQDVLQQAPSIWRVFHKLRGYPGDAEMLDFIYAVEDGLVVPALEQCSEVGKRLYAYISNVEAAQAVRARRRIISEKIDAIAAGTPQAHILSLACGHLREAKYCSALQAGKLGRYIAIDQDKESLAVVEREAGVLGVETGAASVRDLLRGRVTFANFDFVYAAGLYDYLTLSVAQRLTEILFAMLKPGGQLLIANFLPDINNAGFMEAYLDWWLIYRTRTDLLMVADTLPMQHIENRSIFVEEHANIAFLEVLKKN